MCISYSCLLIFLFCTIKIVSKVDVFVHEGNGVMNFVCRYDLYVGNLDRYGYALLALYLIGSNGHYLIAHGF